MFITGGVDNIDYNSSFTTATTQSVLHGTGISILEHIPVDVDKEQPAAIWNEAKLWKRTVRPLPASYSVMEDVSLTKDEVSHVPPLQDINSNPVPSSKTQQKVLEVVICGRRET